MTGLFISFEGGEGAGKTTQIKLLIAALEQQGRTVFSTRCPGGEPIAEQIRSVLLNADSPVNARCEMLLFTAARAQVTEHIIRPRLENGEVVIIDRFIDSTTAYQGHARNLDIDDVRAINLFATAGIVPDITILLDSDPVVGLSRQFDKNRMEMEPIEFHKLVREAYLAEARAYPKRIKIVSASGTPDEVHLRILEAIRPLLNGAT